MKALQASLSDNVSEYKDAVKVPELLRTLVGKNITPEIESKLTEMETYVDEIGRNVYIIYFRDVVETICKAVSEMDYYYWRVRVTSC